MQWWHVAVRSERRQRPLVVPDPGGVAVVDPESLTIVTEPPRVAIEEVTLDGASLGVRDRITIKPGQANLVIHYTALTYSRPEQTTFRYRLDGVDTDWHDAGLRRRLDYSHLPPGRHRFRLIARNSDGVVSTAERTLAIEVVPPFYLTIRDNGEGLGARPSPAAGTGGFGMTGLQERALLLQGTLEVESEPGRGTRLTFDFPTPASP